jgi:NADH-quinone oxidoreductase subunit C
VTLSASTVEDKLAERLKGQLPEADIKILRPRRLKVSLRVEALIATATFLKEQIGLDHCITVSGTDYPKEDSVELSYHLTSISSADYRPIVLILSTRLPRSNPVAPSLVSVWSGANFHERETWEMLGIVFEGHPRLERLLLPEDWTEGPPLRKD